MSAPLDKQQPTVPQPDQKGIRRVSMCVSVSGALKELLKSRAKLSYWNDDNGKPLTRLQAIDALVEQLAEGKHTLPLSKECGSPCQHADKGCTGFNYGKNGGCPGFDTGTFVTIKQEAA